MMATLLVKGTRTNRTGRMKKNAKSWEEWLISTCWHQTLSISTILFRWQVSTHLLLLPIFTRMSHLFGLLVFYSQWPTLDAWNDNCQRDFHQALFNEFKVKPIKVPSEIPKCSSTTHLEKCARRKKVVEKMHNSDGNFAFNFHTTLRMLAIGWRS